MAQGGKCKTNTSPVCAYLGFQINLQTGKYSYTMKENRFDFFICAQ